MTEPLVQVEHLKKYYEVKTGLLGFKRKEVKAVNDVSFQLRKGETLGLVGESGCGKSTTGRLLMRLTDPTEGRVFFDGNDMTELSGERLRKERKKFQMIFQDPYASLNPRMTIREIIEEPLIIHGEKDKAKRMKRVDELMHLVGLSRDQADRYAYEFSGGQRQRIGIARALALNPELIIADEPVSALDVSIQAQIVNLLQDLQEKLGLTYLFISHDLSIIEHISDRIAVMYLGKIMEIANKKDLYANPLHPYTQALISAIPIPDPKIQKKKIVLKGDIPSPADPPHGCPFHTRCPKSFDRCRTDEPKLREEEADHLIACHLYT